MHPTCMQLAYHSNALHLKLSPPVDDRTTISPTSYDVAGRHRIFLLLMVIKRKRRETIFHPQSMWIPPSATQQTLNPAGVFLTLFPQVIKVPCPYSQSGIAKHIATIEFWAFKCATSGWLNSPRYKAFIGRTGNISPSSGLAAALSALPMNARYFSNILPRTIRGYMLKYDKEP